MDVMPVPVVQARKGEPTVVTCPKCGGKLTETFSKDDHGKKREIRSHLTGKAECEGTLLVIVEWMTSPKGERT